MNRYVKKTKPALWLELPSQVRRLAMAHSKQTRAEYSRIWGKDAPRAIQKRLKAIPRRSKRMIGLMAKYRKQKEQFLKERPYCLVCIGEANKVATEVHHRKGRGKYLLDESTWTPVCRTCHTYIHDNPSWAYGEGWMEKRI